MQSEVKRNIQGTNSALYHSNQWFGAEEINIQPKQNEETGIQKKEERLRKFWDNFKRSNIQIIGMPEGEEQELEIENLFEKNNGEVPQSGKGNRLPGSPGSSESQGIWTQGSTHQGTS